MNLITNIDVLKDGVAATLGDPDALHIIDDDPINMMPDIADIEVWWGEEHDELLDYWVDGLEFKQGWGKDTTIATLPGKYYGRQIDELAATLAQYSEEARNSNWEEWKEFNA